MRNIILLVLLLLAGFVQGQKLTPFQNRDGKWGIKNDKGEIIIKSEYDRLDTADYNSLEFYKHNVLAAIVDSAGKYFFQPPPNVIESSNAYLHYYYKDPMGFKTLKDEIDNSLFIYLNDAKLDTVVFIDTLYIEDFETGEYNEHIVIKNEVAVLSQGSINLVNSKSGLLNKIPFQNIALKTVLANLESGEPIDKVFFQLKNGDYNFGNYYVLIPKIIHSNMPFQQDNKWGLFSINDGIIVDAVYDSYKVGFDNSIEFFNHNVLAAIVDEKGNYLFKPDEDLVARSNLYLEYSLAHNPDNDTSIAAVLSNNLFLYITEGQLDTLVYYDTILVVNEYGDLLDKLLTISVPDLKKGELVLVDAEGKSLNEKAFDNLAFKAVARGIGEDMDPLTLLMVFSNYYSLEEYSYIDVKNVKNNHLEIKSFYRPSLPNIQSKLLLFEQNNKWGLLQLDKGVLIEPKYDSYEYDGQIYFINGENRIISVDDKGSITEIK